MKEINLKAFSFLVEDFVKFHGLQEKVASSANAFNTVVKEVYTGLKKERYSFTDNVEQFCNSVKAIQGKTLSKLGHDPRLQKLVK